MVTNGPYESFKTTFLDILLEKHVKLLQFHLKDYLLTFMKHCPAAVTIRACSQQKYVPPPTPNH